MRSVILITSLATSHQLFNQFLKNFPSLFVNKLREQMESEFAEIAD